MKKIIYHYTEYVALDGILKRGNIRLNNILNMNDATEMRFFINAIKELVVKRLISEGKIESANRIEKFIENETKEEYHYASYAACFSEHRDDASQWDRYGNSGKGVCIGFDKDLLQSLTGGFLSLQKVFYEADVSFHPLTEKLYNLAMEPTYSMDDVKEIMEEIWTASAAFKHPSFASEKEIRLVVSPFIDDEFAVEPQYNIAINRIKKYYPLELGEMCKRSGYSMDDLITEIIIGPTSTQSISILQDYFRDCGLVGISEKIKISDCPLRSSGL